MTGDDRLTIETDLVRRLVAGQFPQWATLPITRVTADGWDNSSFRLGETMKVRLPTAARYAAQVEKEHRWLPRLAPRLPLPIPRPLAIGAPGEGYPFPWSIQSWLPGTPAASARIADPRRLGADLAGFLRALQAIDPREGPPAGPHSFFRGGPLAVYDAETRRCLRALQGEIDSAGATALWEAALAAPWQGPAVWAHGDVAAGNLLVENGRLSAVIDFGSCAVGDPACDLVVAWTLLSGEGRAAFRTGLGADEGTWARARGWALWKALLVLAEGAAASRDQARRVVAAVLAERQRSGGRRSATRKWPTC